VLYAQEEQRTHQPSFTPLRSSIDFQSFRDKSELCLNGWWNCWLVGEVGLVAIIVQMSGGWFLCLMWCIWGEHNARNFEDCERTVIELKAMMFKTLYGWIVFFFFFFFK